jgi:CelD/BcsL family acetyltransferase involved in cellulose biosynthesis
MTENIHVRVLEESAWASLQAEWGSLLQRSRADPLFLSLDWLRLWWKHFEPQGDEALKVLAVYVSEELIGLAPFIIGSVKRRMGLRYRSAQMVGNWLDESRGMFSEYLDVLAVPGRDACVRLAVARTLLRELDCAEIVVACTREHGPWRTALAQINACYLRPVEPQLSFQAWLGDGFGSYARKLGSSTRRSLINLRSRLEAVGPVSLVRADAAAATAALDELGSFHALRWGMPPFVDNVDRFHRELIGKWAPLGKILISRLLVGQRCVSVLYDIRIGQTQYNLQMGFDPAFEAKASLGLMHLGYAMEQAAGEGVKMYDFLAGTGLKSDYKRNLASQWQTVATVHGIAGFLPKLAYRSVDRARALSQSLFSSVESSP